MSNSDRLLNETVRLLGSIPDKSTFLHDLPQNHEWVGSVLFVLNQSSSAKLGMQAEAILQSLRGSRPRDIRNPSAQLVILLQQLKKELEFELGYSIPRNYFELDMETRAEASALVGKFEKAIREDNLIDPTDREIVLSEIAIFEASLGVARLSPDIIARFANGVLKGTVVLAAGEVVRKLAADLVEKLFGILGWPLSG